MSDKRLGIQLTGLMVFAVCVTVIFTQSLTPVWQIGLSFLALISAGYGATVLFKTQLPKLIKRAFAIGILATGVALVVISMGRIVTGETSFLDGQTWLYGLGVAAMVLAIRFVSNLIFPDSKTSHDR